MDETTATMLIEGTVAREQVIAVKKYIERVKADSEGDTLTRNMAIALELALTQVMNEAELKVRREIHEGLHG